MNTTAESIALMKAGCSFCQKKDARTYFEGVGCVICGECVSLFGDINDETVVQEREACAKILDEKRAEAAAVSEALASRGYGSTGSEAVIACLEDMAAKIRARGEVSISDHRE